MKAPKQKLMMTKKSLTTKRIKQARKEEDVTKPQDEISRTILKSFRWKKLKKLEMMERMLTSRNRILVTLTCWQKPKSLFSTFTNPKNWTESQAGLSWHRTRKPRLSQHFPLLVMPWEHRPTKGHLVLETLAP